MLNGPLCTVIYNQHLTAAEKRDIILGFSPEVIKNEIERYCDLATLGNGQCIKDVAIISLNVVLK